MAKLTVYFKDKVVHSGFFENGVIHIGRDETNDLVIDSLAVAAVHAVIVIKDDSSSIKQLADDFPIIINGEKFKECVLKNSDTITLGKHDIQFTNSVAKGFARNPQENINDPMNRDLVSLNQQIDRNVNTTYANLQVIAGSNLGKLIPLKNDLTRLGHNGSGVVVIEKRQQSYFVSLLKNEGNIKLNNQPLNGIPLKINNHDILTLDTTSLQFFQSEANAIQH